MMSFDDNRKIGIGLILLGMVLYSFGVLLLLDRALLSMGNIAFLLGLVILIGFKNSLQFFTRKAKIYGSLAFFAGLLLIILFGRTVIGTGAQLYGLFLLFRTFIRTIFSWLQTMPVIGPIIRHSTFIQKIVDAISGGGKQKTEV